MKGVINPDDICSALYARLYGDAVFRSMVTSITKGPKRPNPPPGQNRPKNPSATVHVLTAVVDEELGSVRSTAVVNVYVDDLPSGQMDAQGLGQRSQRVQYLLHKAHLPGHPAGRLNDPYLRFHTVYVSEPLLLPGDVVGEHMASVRLNMILETKE
ncbi:MAG: hypothetical protein BAA04_04840 [Firmicutes bacterium ZCTH02-B6]|nr:MAG: hypothetical protein BAA04_04840 [Firmicutes bacterium ZCTH02-B6]